MRITANTQRGLRSNEIIVTESVQIKGFGKSVKNISERERAEFIGSKNSGQSAAVFSFSGNLLSRDRQGILFPWPRGHLSCLRRDSEHFQIGIDF